MMVRILLAFVCILVSYLSASAKVSANIDSIPYPHKWLKNSQMQVLVFVPDKENGYYRSTRFDWSGIVAQVFYKGHTFFRPWGYSISRTYPLTMHHPDSVNDGTGTVEEFRQPLGFSEAKSGEYFVKIGVGVLVKPDNEPYNFARRYEMKTPIGWEVCITKQRIDFVQIVSTDFGYAYRYVKSIIIHPHKPEFTISHTLQNIGNNPIITNTYCHNFILLDGQQTGDGYEAIFSDSIDINDFKNESIVHSGGKLVLKGKIPHTDAFGFPIFNMEMKNEVVIGNTNSKTSIHISGNQALSSFYFWLSSTAICPEPMIDIHLKAGKSVTWEIRYVFRK